MSKRKTRIIMIAVIVIALIAGISVYAATNYGTSSDPLITKSYLDGTLTPQLTEAFKNELDSAVSGMGGDSGTFTVVTLSKGQTVTCSVGCEIMLRIGTASVKADDAPGLVDSTTGGTLNNGQGLTANHLYMVTIEGNGISATAGTVKVLISGSYSVS